MKVLGLMSGTSMDGLDCSYIQTDGNNHVSIIAEKTYEYSNAYKNKLKQIINFYNLNQEQIKIKKYENYITQKFIEIISKFFVICLVRIMGLQQTQF